MEKRYQVFISSTFTDLQDERAKVQQAIMEMDCIPAGMEVFPAIDEEQFEFIKKVIDDCDYYILIIGGRYGSLSDAGVSYTEMEYEYAVNKGLKVMAFLHNDPNSLPVKKTEQVTGSKKKLAAFREKVASGRLVKAWSVANELPGLVALSLSKTIKTYPTIGWIRGDSAADPALYKELSSLRKENQELKEAAAKRSADVYAVDNIAGLDEVVTIKGFGGWYESESAVSWTASLSWAQLFKIASPYIPNSESEQTLSGYIADGAQIFSNKASTKYDSNYLANESKQLLRIQFKALGLIKLSSMNKDIHWSLTPKGEAEMTNLLVVRKAELTNVT
ncbi:DUF4062 domain-containing protein [Hymenobacter sp. UV11]|uniref:DUF4062 domain-containing protein n=1 Tax=Hymenobacter sp. UV11 TaxID=1849735 RepID=UPI00106078D6|nr:DUF4062 domain-containing protein [Hymenobacter sp. UV11]TFZ65630.1 DUF4062 domain-containing protein [Hymenobacter sp. UV11]